MLYIDFYSQTLFLSYTWNVIGIKYGKIYGYVTYHDGFQLTLLFISTNRQRDLRQTVNMNFYHGTKVSLKLVLYCYNTIQ